MRIKTITLNNFGSYENETVFDFNSDNEKNIVIIGGKNGAGKTTLFTAIKVCLYGYRTFGYQTINAYYKKQILKIVNNSAKLHQPATSNVQISFNINNGHEWDDFTIKRIWIVDNNTIDNETLVVYKNGQQLSSEDVVDFEAYIMQIIPPDLFNMYFFDGEKISDFFLQDGSNTRIKQAFLTLCGYDTFDIMSKNFKRQKNLDKNSEEILSKYLDAKNNFTSGDEELISLKSERENLLNEIIELESNLLKLDLDYRNSGGTSQKEWDNELAKIKTEEDKRESINLWLKNISNSTLPFLMLKEEMQELKSQIITEEAIELNENFSSIIKERYVIDLISKEFEKSDKTINSNLISQIMYEVSDKISKNQSKNKILMLSLDEKATILHTISNINEFDEDSIQKAVNKISSSIKTSSKIRKNLEKCSVDYVKEYIIEKERFIKSKSQKLAEVNILETQEIEKKVLLDELKKTYEKVQKDYEIELKKGSIKDLSAKAIVFLDKLQDRLYAVQIKKVESLFENEIVDLMRKNDFISNIEIDKDFNIKIFRKKYFDNAKLEELRSYSFTKLKDLLGDRAANEIKDNNSSNGLISIEIDKNSMSSGEKQIFIMALYKSLIQLSRHKVPFVIDTPFARIDTEHRENIVQYFFQKLEGQVFILSTNEEIDSSHLSIMKNNLQGVYTLNNNEISTSVESNSYFGKGIIDGI